MFNSAPPEELARIHLQDGRQRRNHSYSTGPAQSRGVRIGEGP